MTQHKTEPGEIEDDFRSGGTRAGDKAGLEMLAKCGPIGNVDANKFSGGLIKAHDEACNQMRSTGASETNIAAWSKAFWKAMKPHLDRVKTLSEMMGKKLR
jgi:hypothetical protein